MLEVGTRQQNWLDLARGTDRLQGWVHKQLIDVTVHWQDRFFCQIRYFWHSVESWRQNHLEWHDHGLRRRLEREGRFASEVNLEMVVGLDHR